MTTDATSTIFALSSGHGRAGVAVVRVSGPASGVVLEQMAAPRPRPRYAGLRRIGHPDTGEMLDEGLVLWFPAPKSETGEDMAELQIHGGGAVVRAVLDAIGRVPGCRMAEPGEFARRAFENGRLDLTAAEGLADLVDAETDAQRRQALVQASGGLALLYDGWREALLKARALTEAGIDFSDEGDVAADAMAKARARVQALVPEIKSHLDDGLRGEIVRDGFRVVLAGPPNVGKSSLLNALARRDVAIVSAEPGTTRDVIEVRLDIGGYAVVLSDTAGLRETASGVEQEGMRRTLARSREADLVLWVVDATEPGPVVEPPAELLERGRADVAAVPAPLMVVINKIDAVGDARRSESGEALPGRHEGQTPTRDALGSDGERGEPIRVSARTGAGLGALTARIGEEVQRRVGAAASPPPSQARHRAHLMAAREALARFLDGEMAETELRAEDLRIAADALGRITGLIGVEDVLGAIFGRFCIGK